MMKKLISLVAIAAFMLAMAGCAVNANTGSITVMNRTDKAATGVKIGTVNIGYVGPGATTTVYFFSDEAAAEITVGDFSKQDGLVINTASGLKETAGTIDLKKNYLYTLTLTIDGNGNYEFSCYGVFQGKKSNASDFYIFENAK